MGKSKKEKTIGGIGESKLNEASIDAAIERLELEVPENDAPALARKVGVLMEYFEDLPEDDRSGECENCGSVSSVEFDSCPFCGMDDDLKPSSLLAKEPDVEVIPATPLQYPVPQLDLDKAVEKIKGLLLAAMVNQWHLACEMTDLSKSQMWKQRTNDKGDVAHRTFEEFAKTELGMTSRYANELLRLRVEFTEEQVRQYPFASLRIVMTAPKERRELLMEKLKEGATRADLGRELGHKGKYLGGPGRGKSESKTPENGGKITVAHILGRKTIDLFAKPKGDGYEAKPATKISDQPWGQLDLNNDVRMYIVILQKPTGELYARVEHRRTDDA